MFELQQKAQESGRKSCRWNLWVISLCSETMTQTQREQKTLTGNSEKNHQIHPTSWTKANFYTMDYLKCLGCRKNPRKWKENLLGAAPEWSHSSLKQKDKHEEGIKLLTGTQRNTTRFFHRLFNNKKPTMYSSFISAQSLHPKLLGAKNKEQGTPFLLKITL